MSQEEMIAAMVSAPTALHVGFDDLSIYRLEDGRYAVNWIGNPKRADREDWEELFEDPKAAAALFEQKRMEYELGLEFEASGK